MTDTSAAAMPSSTTTADGLSGRAARATLVGRIGLLILAVEGFSSGVWSTASPRSYYDDFPGFGLHWVRVDGPYNEHLMRDYGALNLALGAVALCAAIWLTRTLVVTAAIAWIVYSVPHLAYHLFNGQHFESTENVAVIVALLIAPGVALVVLWSVRRPS
jgi:hypothetical protein